MDAGLRPGARPPQRQSQLIVRLRVVGRESDRFTKSLDGAGAIARLQFLNPDADGEGRGLRVRRPLIQPVGFGEFRLRGVMLAQLLEGLSEAAVRFGGVRLELERLSERRHRLG